MNSPHPTQADELDESLDALSHPLRRKVLTRLTALAVPDTPELEVEELVEEGDRGNETILLSHNHLPRLADSGFIDWDRERNVVTRGPQFDEVEAVIDVLASHEAELPANWP